jgi:hypothetical protein
MKRVTCIAALFISLFTTQSALATGFRCGSAHIIEGLRVGITQYEVTKLCGEPVAKNGNRWIYDRPVDNISILVFDSVGQLVAIHKR